MGPRCLICGETTVWFSGDYECLNKDCVGSISKYTSEEVHSDQQEEPVGHIHYRHGDDADFTGGEPTAEQQAWAEAMIKELEEGAPLMYVPPDAQEIIDKAVKSHNKLLRNVFISGAVAGIVAAKIVSKFNKKGQ